DYWDLEAGSNLKHEYYKGEIYLMSGARMDHNTIMANMIIEIGSKLKETSCQVLPSEMRVMVEENTLITYPDISIVCGEPTFLKADEMELTNPAVIIEILSPSTKVYDRGEKFQLYRALTSLQEYILVDSKTMAVEQFIKDAQGSWNGRKYAAPDDLLTIAITGVSLPLHAIYERVRSLRKAK